MEVMRAEDRCAHLSSFWGRGSCAYRRLVVLGILLFALAGQYAQAGDPDAKNVLVMFGSVSAGYEPFLNLIESSARAQVPEQVNFYVAYLDYQRLEEESYRESLAETLRRGYSEVKLDLLVLASIHSLQFVMEYRDSMFPGV